MDKSLLKATAESLNAIQKLNRERNISPEQSMELALWNIAIALADIADSLRDREDEDNGQ